MQLSTIVGTIILSPDGEKLGYVKEARLSRDFSSLSCLVAVDEDEEEFYMPARTVLAVKDAVIAGKARIAAPTGLPAPMGRSVFSEHGEYLGTVTDMHLADIPALTVSKDESAENVPLSRAAVGETVIVFQKERKKRAAPYKSGKSAPKKPHPDGALRPNEEHAPERPAANRFNRFNLLGKRVKKSVFDEYGMPVALAGERVTPEMLETARRRHLLLALTVNTLTNVL